MKDEIFVFKPNKEMKGNDVMSMRKNMLSIMLAVATGTGVMAESSVWKAQKGDAVIYLGGTCHLLRAEDYPLPPEFEHAYQSADTLVFETDINKLKSPAMTQLLISQAVYTDGSTVEGHLQPATFAKLRDYCASNNIPLTALQQFKPSMLMTTLTVIELMKIGAGRDGVDMFFHNQAARDNKPVQFLETVEAQIDFLLSMGQGYEDAFVEYSLSDLGSVKERFDEIVKAWKLGEEGKIDDVFIAQLKTKMPKVYQQLIVKRNRDWLPILEAYIKTPATEFVLVGIAHLAGKDGLIKLLEKKGYTVEKLVLPQADKKGE